MIFLGLSILFKNSKFRGPWTYLLSETSRGLPIPPKKQTHQVTCSSSACSASERHMFRGRVRTSAAHGLTVGSLLYRTRSSAGINDTCSRACHLLRRSDHALRISVPPFDILTSSPSATSSTIKEIVTDVRGCNGFFAFLDPISPPTSISERLFPKMTKNIYNGVP